MASQKNIFPSSYHVLLDYSFSLIQNPKMVNYAKSYFSWHPFGTLLYASLLSELKKVGVIFSLLQNLSDQELLEHLSLQHYDGILTNRTLNDSKTASQLKDAMGKITCVQVVRGGEECFHSVGIDNTRAMELLVSHLRHQGYHKIGYVSYTINKIAQSSTIGKRWRAWRQALKERGLSYSPERVFWIDDNDQFWRGNSVENFLQSKKHKFDALVCFNDQIAFRVLKVAKKCGIKIPEELGLTGIDGIVVEEGEVPLTTVSQDPGQLASAAVKLIFQVMQLPNRTAQQSLFISPKLIKGVSGSRKVFSENSPNKDTITLTQMQECLCEHLTQSDPVLFLSHRWGVGRIHVQRLFQQFAGVSCFHFIQHKRIEKAGQLLKSKPIKINFIAQEVGFLNLRTFNRLFKKQFSISPSEYRRIHQKNW